VSAVPRPEGWAHAERAARESYGRLVAWLAYRWRDLAAAEDAMADALLAALEHWPVRGVPERPDAWLLTVARRQLLQRARHDRMAHAPDVLALLDEPDAAAAEAAEIPDDRLALFFVCAHPDIPAPVHAPLMLQTVLGLDAATIASAFLVAPSAMAQRLVRAKSGIRERALRFEVPERREWGARLPAVLEGIYGAYSIGAQAAGADVQVAAELPGEALALARILAHLAPDEPEVQGLLALILYCEGRRPARFDAHGRFVALESQAVGAWDRGLIDEAEQRLRAAARAGRPGRFQWEAAIQSAHCQRMYGGSTPWPVVASLYGRLVEVHGTVGAAIGHAVATAEAGAPEVAIRMLDALPPDAVKSHQPYWAARAHLERRLGRDAAARDAAMRAMGLTRDARVRAFLQSTFGVTGAA
jgi:RNA polymerase sigma-70 factor (ECF subfamily)